MNSILSAVNNKLMEGWALNPYKIINKLKDYEVSSFSTRVFS